MTSASKGKFELSLRGKSGVIVRLTRAIEVQQVKLKHRCDRWKERDKRMVNPFE
jgi:hypothetical protein